MDPRIIGLLQSIDAALKTLIAVVMTFVKGAGNGAVESRALLIQDVVMDTNDRVRALAPSTPLTIADLHALRDHIDLRLDLIDTAIDEPINTRGPVVLPTSPPAGYGSPSDSAIGDAVWNYNYGASGRQTGTWLEWAGAAALRAWVEAVDLPYGDYWRPLLWPLEDPGSYTANYPTFNPGDLVAGESFIDCVTRQNPTALTVSQYYVGGQVYVNFGAPQTLHEWVSTIDETRYREILASMLGGLADPLLPYWPGIELVTLGEAGVLGGLIPIAGPMDGVLIAITAVPTRLGAYSFNGRESFRNLGSLAFVSDNGQAELHQNLGFTDAIYTPKSMFRAASCVFRVDPGVTGTVTPWIRASA